MVPDLCREHGISSAAFGISEACYRYQPKLSTENAEIAEHLVRLTHNQRNWSCGRLSTWAEKRGIRLEHIQPGKPLQNAYIERYNRTVRYDWLGQYLFESIEEVQGSATRWLWTYNHERPNMALGGITPRQRLALVA